MQRTIETALAPYGVRPGQQVRACVAEDCAAFGKHDAPWGKLCDSHWREAVHGPSVSRIMRRTEG